MLPSTVPPYPDGLRSRVTVLALALILLIGGWSLAPGLSGIFFFDDDANIAGNHVVHLAAIDLDGLRALLFQGKQVGPLARPLSYLSFGIDYYFSGLSPVAYKATNIAIHLASGVAVYVLVYLLLVAAAQLGGAPLAEEGRLRAAALACTALWLFQPMGLQSVLYVVQRMTSLAALFTFLGLAVAMEGRLGLARGAPGARLRMCLGIGVFTPLAALSKENGALLPFYLALIEATLFRSAMLGHGDRRFLRGFYAITVVLPLLVVAWAFVQHWSPWVAAPYEHLAFTLPERLLTEARAMWFYLGMTLFPTPRLISLFHDDWAISRGLLDPPATLAAVLGLAFLVLGAGWAWRRHPLLAFGIGFFLLGHVLESTFIPLELVFDHRQYLPALGVLLPVAALTLRPRVPEGPRGLVAVAPWAAIVCLCVFFAGHTYLRAQEWGDPLQFALRSAERQPDSPRSQMVAAGILQILGERPGAAGQQRERLLTLAKGFYQRAAGLAPEQQQNLFPLLTIAEQAGQGMDEVVDRMVAGLRRHPTAKLFNTALGNFIRCQLEETCRQDPANTHRILDALLAKTDLLKDWRAEALHMRADYRFFVDRDHRGALTDLIAAVALAPQDLESRMTLVLVLGQLGVLDTAREELATVRRLDLLQSRKRRIDLIEAQLEEDERAQARRAAPPSPSPPVHVGG